MEAAGLLWILAVILVIVGLAGTVLPALPGAPLVFLGLLLAAWADGFQKVGWFPLTLLGILTAGTFAVDFLATSLGAKRVGASYLAIVGAVVGTIAGLFLGVPGLLLGPFVGAVLGEYIARRDLRQAGKVGLGTWLGLVLGTAAKLGLIFLMIGLFVFAYVI
ncbi:MAG TPA: DUF456 domain-containing protein [Thermoanaerobaculia bacterium]|nr:DUF456 domain-containing protein [Thermoanaerobaculia bacterium]